MIIKQLMMKMQNVDKAFVKSIFVCMNMIIAIIFVDNSLPNYIQLGWYKYSVYFVVANILLLFLCDNKKEVSFCKIDFIFVFILVYILVTAHISGVYIYEEQMLIMSLLCFWFVLKKILSDKTIIVFVVSIIALSSIEGLLGFCQFIQSHNKADFTGSFFNSGSLGGFISISIPLIVGEILISYKKNIRYLLILLLLLDVVFLSISNSRSAWVAALGGVVFILIKHYKVVFVQYLSLKNILILFTVIIVSSYCLYSIRPKSANGRVLIWKIILFNIDKVSLFGEGVNNYVDFATKCQENYFKKYKKNQDEILIANTPEFAFNEYIQIIIENGVIGGGLIVYFFYYLIRKSIKKNKRYDSVLASLLTIGIFSFFSYPLRLYPFLIVLLLIMSIIRSTIQESYICNKKYPICEIYLILSVCVLLLFVDYYKYVNQYKKFINEYQTFKFRKSIEINNVYEIYYPILKNDQTFLYELSLWLYKTGRYEECIKRLNELVIKKPYPMAYIYIGKSYQKLEMLEKAEKMYLKVSNILPNRFYPLYLLMNLYLQQNNVVDSEMIAKKIIDKNVKINSNEIIYFKNEAIKVLQKKSDPIVNQPLLFDSNY